MNHNTILYFGGFELPDKNAAAQRAISISKSLRDIGFKVVLFGLSKVLSEQDGIAELSSTIHGIEMRERAYPRTVGLWINHLFSCEQEIEIIKKTPSIKAVICYNYPAIVLWRINNFCVSKNITLIADVTEWYSPSAKGFPLNVIKNIDTYLRMQYVQPKLKNIMCISKFLYDYYKHRVSNCVLLPGTIDQTDEKWQKSIAYMPNTPFTLGYAGDPGIKCEKERIDLLISAVCELNAEGYSCHLKVAGFEQASFEMEYSQLVNRAFYKECIHYFGRLSHKECLQLIRSVDYSVIVREDKRATSAGFPTKLSESFACGTPVISTPSSNVADFIIQGQNGIITKDFSYESLVEAIKSAVSSTQFGLIEQHRLVSKHNKLEYKQYTDIIEKFINRYSNEVID